MKTFATAFGKTFLVIGLPVSIIFSACAGSSSEERSANKSTYDYAEAPPTDISANAKQDSVLTSNVFAPMTVGKTNDSNHVFMRNADMRFSVKDVRQATLDIEKLVRKYDGFVTYTSLTGNKYLNNSVRVSKDSIMEVYKMNVTNEITLRVPNVNLDSTLIELNGIIEFIDNRTIRADDVKLQLLATSLKAKRNLQHINKLDKKIDDQGKKLPQTVHALNDLNYSKTNYDEQQLNLMDLTDKVSYSTVKMYVYQPEVMEYKKSMLPAIIKPYSPSFGDRLSSALNTGLTILQAILLFFATIWPLLFLFVIIWFTTKWIIRTKILARVFKI
ncbi:MAG: DUF4349 domain-containing protein [Bacteroidota bacterium]|nr:DUF4349 domain-containing protein [Bacteroidota bacterium]